MTKPLDIREEPDDVEALIRGAGQYVRPSEDLRPRVLESARAQSHARLTERRIWQASLAIALLGAIVTASGPWDLTFAVPLNTLAIEASAVNASAVDASAVDASAVDANAVDANAVEGNSRQTEAGDAQRNSTAAWTSTAVWGGDAGWQMVESFSALRRRQAALLRLTR